MLRTGTKFERDVPDFNLRRRGGMCVVAACGIIFPNMKNNGESRRNASERLGFMRA